MRRGGPSSEVPCWVCGRALDFSRLARAADAHPFCREQATRHALNSLPITMGEWAARVSG